MNKKKIVINIFSNWTNLVLVMAAAFIVSPIIVHGLGNEKYGIWVLIVSTTGYFTVLDFGVNTALIRFISKYMAQDNKEKTRQIYSNAFVFFFCVSLIVILFSLIFAYFFGDVFKIKTIPRPYLYTIFLVVGIELAFNLLFSVFMGTLRALQEFLRLNIISIIFMVFKNGLIVIFMLNGHSLLTIALIQLATTLAKISCQYLLINKSYPFLRFHKSDCDKGTLKEIFNYSIYSFMVAIALKVLFFTDSIVIGAFVSVTAVTFYSIPMTLMLYLEKIIYAAMSVFTPVISANDATGETGKNQQIYILGTQSSLMVSLPILFVLFTNGDSFISIWMGVEYGAKCAKVIMILSVGYLFALSQVIANGILKGISKHKVFAYILSAEALVNLIMSVALAKKFGIEGVALGTAIPLIVTNLFIVPFYTCKVLKLNYYKYLNKSHSRLLLFTSVLGIMYFYMPIKVFSYFQLIAYSLIVLSLYGAYSFYIVLDQSHRSKIVSIVEYRLKRAS